MQCHNCAKEFFDEEDGEIRSMTTSMGLNVSRKPGKLSRLAYK